MCAIFLIQSLCRIPGWIPIRTLGTFGHTWDTSSNHSLAFHKQLGTCSRPVQRCPMSEINDSEIRKIAHKRPTSGNNLLQCPARRRGHQRLLHQQAALRRHLLLQQAQRDREGPGGGGGAAGQVRRRAPGVPGCPASDSATSTSCCCPRARRESSGGRNEGELTRRDATMTS